MNENMGNYAKHAAIWDWGGYDRTQEHEYWRSFAEKYGKNVLIPFCALGESGAYMAERGFNVTGFDFTPEMIYEGKRRFGGTENLRLLTGDVRDFRFDITPVDFCFTTDFGHIHSMEEIKRALLKINFHLRCGGCLVIETELPPRESMCTPLETFYPKEQVFKDKKVWKTGVTRLDAATARRYISQTVFIEDEGGSRQEFDHSFYLQIYSRDAWTSALKECGFEIKSEHKNRERELYEEGGNYWICQAVKSQAKNQKYCPSLSLDYLQTPNYRYEEVSLYGDSINLQQPNDGYLNSYRFDINAGGQWVGFISVKIGYSITAYYDGQIGYEIYSQQHRSRGYATKACLALIPFLQKCGFRSVLLTTDETNTPSRRVCEKISCKLLEITDTPTWTGIYERGQRRTCIYEWQILKKENG